MKSGRELKARGEGQTVGDLRRPARDRAGLGRHVGLTGSRSLYALEDAEVVAAMGSTNRVGLSPAEASGRVARHGESKITSEKPPYVWEVPPAQRRDPMNIMLVAATVVSLVIGQVPTAILVALLAFLSVVLGTRQERPRAMA